MAKTADGDEEISRLLAMCAGRVILKGLNEGEKELPDDHTLRHIADWISVAVITNAEWLSNLDADGRPKKLMKFSTVEQITAEADKAMRIANQRLSIVEVADDEEIHQELEDGFVLVKMLAPSALDRESAAMQHCIGNGGYDRLLLSGVRTYLSLRDPSGKPHATIEIDCQTKTVRQLQGKQNRAPIKRYIDILRPVLEHKYAVLASTRTLGYAVDENGKWHDIYALQAGLKFQGTLDISGTDLTELPRDLIVTGHLIANDTRLSELPDGLVVRGNVELRRSEIRRLGNAVKVNGNMDLAGSRMMLLPTGLSVGGSLDLSNTKIWVLPNGLRVGNTLDISNTDVSALPEDISVRVQIKMYRTGVETLPDCLDDELVVYRTPPQSSWYNRPQSVGCLAADMKIRPKPPGALKRLFGFV